VLLEQDDTSTTHGEKTAASQWVQPIASYQDSRMKQCISNI